MLKIETDYVVVGSGLAGLATALKASAYGQVVVLSKDKLNHCNSTLAQGGIAAAVGPEDSPRLHAEDTLFAGAGICDPVVVDVLTREGIEIVDELIALGTKFDLSPSGEFSLGREGAHRLARVLHHGDLTGAEIWRALYERIQRIDAIRFMPGYRAEELLVSNEQCYGVVAQGEKERIWLLSKGVVLATGGCGQIFGRTTSSLLSTGDGMALAYRAGALLTDLEFIQFHPTAFDSGERPYFLISEAVRGEGAVLVTETGERFMSKVHPMADLAPRDVVSRAIAEEQEKGHRVYLDATGLGPEFAQRFPNIHNKLAEKGINTETDWIPVTPAAHFTIGGIRTDAWGRTNIKGLFACGEAASTGVHGANRLASNSLLEALVFGNRVATGLADLGKAEQEIDFNRLNSIASLDDGEGVEGVIELDFQDPRVKAIQNIMWSHVGIVRSAQGMSHASQALTEMKLQVGEKEPEFRDLLLVAELVTKAAIHREESRGSHFRIDYPETSSLWQSKHLNQGKFSA